MFSRSRDGKKALEAVYSSEWLTRPIWPAHQRSLIYQVSIGVWLYSCNTQPSNAVSDTRSSARAIFLYTPCVFAPSSLRYAKQRTRVYTRTLRHNWDACHLWRVTVPSCQRGQLTYRNVLKQCGLCQFVGGNMPRLQLLGQMLQLGLHIWMVAHFNWWLRAANGILAVSV